MENEIVGIALVIVGLVLLLSGAAVAIIDAIRGKGSGSYAATDDPWWKKLLDALTAAATAFAKLSPSAALMFSGLLAIGAGLYVLAATPL